MFVIGKAHCFHCHKETDKDFAKHRQEGCKISGITPCTEDCPEGAKKHNPKNK